MIFVGGDDAKGSLNERGITFEQVMAAPILGFITNPAHQGQMLLIVEIKGYAHAAPC